MMLNFDKDRFVRIQSGAVSIANEMRPLMRTRYLRKVSNDCSSWEPAACSC